MSKPDVVESSAAGETGPAAEHSAAEIEASRRRDGMRGIVLMVLSALFFSVMSLLVKVAGQRLPSAMMVLARGVVTLVLSYGILRAARRPVWGKRHGTLLLRGVFGFIGLSCFYYAVTALPLAEATVLQYINPILTALLAIVVLKERPTVWLFVALTVCLVGVVLVVRPDVLFGQGGPALPKLAVAVALVGAVASACAYVTVRSLAQTEDPNVIIFYFPLVAVPATLPFVVPAWIPPTPTEWLLLLGIGISTQIAQIFMTRGLGLLPAGQATSIGFLQIVFAAGWGLMFGEVPGLMVFLGAGLILLGVVGANRARVRREGASQLRQAAGGR